ncbi:SWI/SNF-related matrix-associated actin-dependent regulator of chromatin subfamily E member 1-related-like [Dendronephthya gigantea]|uniref:SWI/SNF-related matrix-associated actin-dependent regulator of chromatin subfamily E member 1-related-like n=1 Tax=Dendronephthya gigantea TaxID=151771 RepID=UPI00106C0B3C|nr:SWI/SNF-related matrix-associated actin-dependent regulator of chromatin subfamily E member 1-related-like [Dendronephthya gigantea]
MDNIQVQRSIAGTTTPEISSMTSTTGVIGSSSVRTLETITPGSTSIQMQPKLTGTTTSPSSSLFRSTLVVTSGKRKLWQDENAPKAPLSAYLQFLNKNREAFRTKNPSMGVHDITKCLGSMWSELPPDQKQIYLDQAERDKKQYVIELKEYHSSDTYKKFVEEREKAIKALKQEELSSPGSHLVCIPCNKWFESTHNFREHSKSRKHQRNVLETQSHDRKTTKITVPGKQELPVEAVREKKTVAQGAPQPSTTQASNFPDMSGISEADLEVPIFSEAFLHYNKSRESELRKLRKATTEIEEQNAILSKHIDNLNSAIGKLDDEKIESEQDIKGLKTYLKNIRELLAQSFSNSELLDTTDVTLSELRELLVKLCNSRDNAITNKVKKAIKDLDYPNCLNNLS